MPISLGTNISSLKAQQQLLRTGEHLSSVFERLSSGQRINRASDDAAGLAISESLNADRRVLNQGVRNLNDGISLLNIADATVSELSGIVMRIQELAEQAANGTLSSVQRASLDTEAQALREEFFRVSHSTEFNGMGLFDGTIENGIRLQAGYGTDGSIFSSLGGKLADGTFGTAASFQSDLGQTNEVMLGDLNGDGILDMVTVGEDGALNGTMEVHIGRGDGTFNDGVMYSAETSGSYALQLGDLNGDGILDIVSAGRADGNNGYATVRLGHGDGTFGTATSFTVEGDRSSGVVLGDLNGDGILDLVSTGVNGTDGETTVRLGVGDGTFGEKTTYAAESYFSFDVTLGDLNGDGVLDLITAGRSDAIDGFATIRLGNGDGTFGTATSYLSETQNTFAVRTVDLNNDGILDLITAGANDGSLGHASIRMGNGDGTFGEKVQYTTQAFQSVDLELQDVNGDGLLDLVTGGFDGSDAVSSIRLGNGDGTFGTSTSFNDGGERVRKIALGDLDGDGVLDFVSVGISDGGTGFSSIRLGNTREGINPLLEFSLRAQTDALQALAPLDRKLASLSEQRGIIGAFQSRIAAASATLTTTAENYASAESRIRDADMAFETSRLTRLNILQQSAAAVLAQANQQPALALQLLE